MSVRSQRITSFSDGLSTRHFADRRSAGPLHPHQQSGSSAFCARSGVARVWAGHSPTLCKRRRGEAAGSLVHLWSGRPPERANSKSKLLISLALPRGLTPVFAVRGRGQLFDCRAALVPACHRRIDGLLPTQSVSGHTFRDRLHLVRSDALELRRFAAGDVKAAMASTVSRNALRIARCTFPRLRPGCGSAVTACAGAPGVGHRRDGHNGTFRRPLAEL